MANYFKIPLENEKYLNLGISQEVNDSAQEVPSCAAVKKAIEEGGGGGGEHPVTSVNGQTGDVELDVDDISGAVSKNYSNSTQTPTDSQRVIVTNSGGTSWVMKSFATLWNYFSAKVESLLATKGYAVTSETVTFARAANIASTFTDRSCASGKWTCVGTITVPANRRPVITVLARFASNSTGRRGVTLSTVANAIGTEVSSQPSQLNLMATDFRAAVNGAYSYAVINTGASMPTEERTYYVYVYQNSGSALTVASRYTLILMNE